MSDMWHSARFKDQLKAYLAHNKYMLRAEPFDERLMKYDNARIKFKLCKQYNYKLSNVLTQLPLSYVMLELLIALGTDIRSIVTTIILIL